MAHVGPKAQAEVEYMEKAGAFCILDCTPENWVACKKLKSNYPNELLLKVL